MTMTDVEENGVSIEDGGIELIENIAIHCALKGDVEQFVQCYEDPESQYKDTVGDLINGRDANGKSPLDLAATLGRVKMVKELINRGADVNSFTFKGRCNCMQYVL